MPAMLPIISSNDTPEPHSGSEAFATALGESHSVDCLRFGQLLGSAPFHILVLGLAGAHLKKEANTTTETARYAGFILKSTGGLSPAMLAHRSVWQSTTCLHKAHPVCMLLSCWWQKVHAEKGLLAGAALAQSPRSNKEATSYTDTSSDTATNTPSRQQSSSTALPDAQGTPRGKVGLFFSYGIKKDHHNLVFLHVRRGWKPVCAPSLSLAYKYAIDWHLCSVGALNKSLDNVDWPIERLRNCTYLQNIAFSKGSVTCMDQCWPV